MPLDADAELDRLLRDSLEPEPASVERVLRHALSGPGRTPPGGNRLLRGALVAAAAMAAVILFARFLGPDPEMPTPAGVEHVGEVVLLQSPSGESWILSARDSAVSLPPGTGLVLTKGDSK